MGNIGSFPLRKNTEGERNLEMKRIVFMHLNDNNFFNQERRPRQRTNDIFTDPFD